MNRIKMVLATTILMSLLTNFSRANDNKITPSEIKSVKIYTSGAVVTRTAKITAEAGTSSLEFDNLSANINPQSVTVSGLGDVTILSVQYNLNYLNEEKAPREITVLEDSVKYLSHESDKLTNLESVYNEESSMILANKSIRNEREGVTAENLKEVADFYRQRLSDIKAKLLDIKGEQERIKKDIVRINSQLGVVKTNRNKPTGTIVLALSANRQTAVTLEISYMITSAGWSPLYDIRAKDVSSPIQLNYKANVYQSSGEDWKNVKLTLSTGNPTISGMMPQLFPWHLNYYTAVPHRRRDNSMAGKSMEQQEAPAGAPMEFRGARIASATYSVDGFVAAGDVSGAITAVNNQLSVDFDIAVPFSVPSDGKVYTVDVQHFDMKAEYTYHAIPKLDKDAFLLARVTGWEALNLLSGNANIFFENSFIGSSYLQMQNASDTLDISLGRDKKISINREKLKDVSKSQSLGGNNVKTMAYEITVRNNKAEAVTITLDDQLPIADNKDIVVKMLENSGADFNEKTGTMSWKINLAPSATEKKKLSYSVKYPKDQIVNGL